VAIVNTPGVIVWRLHWIDDVEGDAVLPPHDAVARITATPRPAYNPERLIFRDLLQMLWSNVYYR